MQVGLVAETITVTAASPLLQTDTSTLSALVTEKAVQDLPVNGRNFVRLVQLAPGANEGLPNSLASGTRPDDRRQTSAISINGALDNQNNQLIDGMDNNERAIGTIGVKPSIDAIAEVKVQTSNYTAETGRTAGGVVNILTKSGTNASAGRRSSLPATIVSTRRTSSPRPSRCSASISMAAASVDRSAPIGRSSSPTTKGSSSSRVSPT